ncbi:MAG: hypothetical protein Tsb006_1110 [Rickettsiaceae bacterium]
MLSSGNKNLNQASAVNHMTKALKGLLMVIEKENQSLKVGQISAIRTIIEEKVAALQAFNEAQLVVEDYVRKGGVFDRESTPMVKLKSMFESLAKLNWDNEVLIRSNLEVSSKIVEMYKDSKTQETLRQFGYNKEGKVSVASNIDKVMPAIGLNDKV